MYVCKYFTYIHTYIHTSPASPERLALSLEHVDHDDLVDVDARIHTYIHTYIHTSSPASPERLALSLEHVDHDDLVDVDARVRVELGHVRACVSSLSS